MWFNWVDFVALACLGIAFYMGLRIGLYRLLLTLAGFFGGLFIGGGLFHYLLPIHNANLLVIINTNLVLILAIYLAIRGFDWGRKMHLELTKSGAKMAEQGAGLILSLAAALIAIWLVAAWFGSWPFAGLSNSVNSSQIVQILDRNLPSVPSALGVFSKLINPNSEPAIYVKTLPNGSQGEAPLPGNNPIIMRAGESVVRITSFGCGGIVDGSGFVVGPSLVATAAHVIAGVKRPIVKVGLQSYAAVPVAFDSNLDFAVLYVPGLKATALPLNATNLDTGSFLYVLSYPRSIYTVNPGILRNHLTVFGPNIYGLGLVGRDIYEIQANVDQGSSGGPVLMPSGQVAGMVLARSDPAYGNYAYAQTSSSLIHTVNRVLHRRQSVGTGVCF